MDTSRYLWLVLSLIFTMYVTVSCQSDDERKQCALRETCGTCIRIAHCSWCSYPNKVTNQSIVRCMPSLPELQQPGLCTVPWINPVSHTTIIEDKPLTSGNSGDVVQIKPQHINIQLRPGVEHVVEFKYKQAKDYPVDLYYLMDLSNSMHDDKEQLSKLGDKLATAMQQLTSNFALGFGSFVDKKELPFVNTIPDKLETPCLIGGKIKCTTPYSFKNHMKLSEDTTTFSMQVKNAQISGNIDSPEGGFDALMQAMVCTEQIGWRPNARHMIVFSTDADYHYAGDAKLAGIVEPNDEQCHMDGDEYTHGLLQDYPSVSQINNKAKEHNMNILFAVTQNVENIYKSLHTEITGSSWGVLTDDSSNIVKFVSDQYKGLTQEVKMVHTAPSDLIVTFRSNCEGGDYKVTDTCKELRKSTVVDFQAVIQVPYCPEDRTKWKQSFFIKPAGINENLQVDVEILCGCDCENPEHSIANASECSGHGDLQCGVCICHHGFVGYKCECDASTTTGNDETTCRADPSIDQICSGRGDCKCGKCDCHKRENSDEHVSGQFCECDNFNSCGTWHGKVCSGKDHGTCNCGICECEPGWTGKNCECPSSTVTCKAQTGSEICSGRGDCVCGQCQCKESKGHRYSGVYCEYCPTCDGRCESLKNCVEYHAYQTNLLGNESNCEGIQVIEVEDLKDEGIKQALMQHVPGAEEWFAPLRKSPLKGSGGQDPSLEQTGEFYPDESEDISNADFEAALCSHPDQVGCTYKYRYIDHPNGSVFIFAKKKECLAQVDIIAVVLGVIGAILVAGLLLLLTWKVATSLHDRREYAKFENERKNAKWDRGSNPLYVQATSTFSNPTFTGGNVTRRSAVSD